MFMAVVSWKTMPLFLIIMLEEREHNVYDVYQNSSGFWWIALNWPEQKPKKLDMFSLTAFGEDK